MVAAVGGHLARRRGAAQLRADGGRPAAAGARGPGDAVRHRGRRPAARAGDGVDRSPGAPPAAAASGTGSTSEVAGRGIVPCAVALVADHCLAIGLNRLEVNIRPENGPSLAVVRKLGLREEGLRRRLLHIDGDWRDHLSLRRHRRRGDRAGCTRRLHGGSRGQSRTGVPRHAREVRSRTLGRTYRRPRAVRAGSSSSPSWRCGPCTWSRCWSRSAPRAWTAAPATASHPRCGCCSVPRRSGPRTASC